MRHWNKFLWRLTVASTWLLLCTIALAATYSDATAVSLASLHSAHDWWRIEMATIIVLILAISFSVIGINSWRTTILSLKWWRLRQRTLILRYSTEQDLEAVLVRLARAWKQASDRGNTFLMERFERRFRIVREVALTRSGATLPQFAECLERAS